MEFLVFSDSHRDASLMREALALTKSKISGVIHLGDGLEDVRRMEIDFPEIPFYYVRGNCDYGDAEDERVIALGGKRVYLTHGHRNQVKSGYQRLVWRAEELDAAACLFGHTHQPALFHEAGILFLNPGSISDPRGGEVASYAVLVVKENGVTGRHIGRSVGGFRPL